MKENIPINDEKKIALLIDAENTSVKYIDVIWSEINKRGNVTYKRMYGDFSMPGLAEWEKKSKDYAIIPIYQQHYTTGKNAADIMLVIDAMDILYRRNVDEFCIVSSDSDFTRLVSRIREDGTYVVGMGQGNASQTLIYACNKYIQLEKIIDEEKNEIKDNKIKENENKDEKIIDEEQSEIKNDKIEENINSEIEKYAITPIEKIKSAINSLVMEAENKGVRANLGSTKSQLQREFPDFDERNYGYTLFRKFIEEGTKFKIEQEGRTLYIVRKNNNNIEKKVYAFIKEKAKSGVALDMLGNEMHNKFPQFKYKDLGYSRLSKFIESVEEVELYAKAKNKYYIREKKK